LPADLYNPVLAAEALFYNWYENLGVMKNLAGPAGMPIKLNSKVDILKGGGQYLDVPVFSPISSLDTRRDLTSASDVTPLKVATRNDNGVRISRKIGPFSFTKSAEWLNRAVGNPGILSAYFAREAMNNMMLTIRNFALASLKAALLGSSGTPHVVSVWAAAARTNLTTGLLNQVKATMGDRMEVFDPGLGAAWALRPESYGDLVNSQLASGVQGIADRAAGTGTPLTLGLPYQLASDAALTTADAGFDKYYSMLMGPECIEVDLIEMEMTPLWMNPKAENVEFVLRADYDFNVRIPGFQWDKTNGGANPTLTAAGTTTNWDVTYTDAREVLAAIAEHNYSAN
jgi:hypothetical protein